MFNMANMALEGVRTAGASSNSRIVQVSMVPSRPCPATARAPSQHICTAQTTAPTQTAHRQPTLAQAPRLPILLQDHQLVRGDLPADHRRRLPRLERPAACSIGLGICVSWQDTGLQVPCPAASASAAAGTGQPALQNCRSLKLQCQELSRTAARLTIVSVTGLTGLSTCRHV